MLHAVMRINRNGDLNCSEFYFYSSFFESEPIKWLRLCKSRIHQERSRFEEPADIYSSPESNDAHAWPCTVFMYYLLSFQACVIIDWVQLLSFFIFPG